MSFRPVFRDAFVLKHRNFVRNGQMKDTLSLGCVSEKNNMRCDAKLRFASHRSNPQCAELEQACVLSPVGLYGVPVASNFEMKMRSRGEPRRTHPRNLLSLFHMLSHSHKKRGAVGV